MIVCALAAVNAIAQTGAGAAIRGRVVEDGRPVEYVYVTLCPAADSTVVAAGTFLDGEFEFSGVEKGRYDLAFACFGYAPKIVRVEFTGEAVDLGEVALQAQESVLKEVTVVGARPQMRREQGRLIVNVDRTALADAGSVIDLLRRSPGLIVGADDKISVFGRGAPVIYINDKEVVSPTQLESLQSTDIDRIEIDRNPSARYSAAGHAVVKIVTKRAAADKISLSVYDYAIFGRRVSNIAGLQFDHKSGKWANLLSYSYSRQGSLNYTHSYEVNTQPDFTIHNDGDIIERYSSNHHNVFSGNEYNINPRNRIGLQFSGRIVGRSFNNVNEQIIRETGREDVHRNNNEHGRLSDGLYDTNIGYQYNPDSVNTFSLILGYAYMTVNGNSFIRETELADGSITDSRIESNGVYKIYSAKADYGFRMWKLADMTAGAKYSQVVNDGASDHWNTDTGESNYSQRSRIDDRIAAAYVEFKKEIGDFSFSGGLRYEYTASNTTANEAKIDTTYNGLFPSLTAGYAKDEFDIGLSYSRRIARPAFYQIDPGKQYIDALSYSVGNPFLRPAFSNNIELSVTLYGVGLIAGYTRKRDYFMNTAVNDPDDPRITRWSHFNIDRMTSFTLGLDYSGTWGFYSGNYEAYVEKPYSKVPFLGGEISRNKALWYASISNNFNITKNLSLNCDFEYQSAGEDGFTYWAASYNLSAGVLWKLFGDRLVLSLKANDILKTANFNNFEDRYLNIVTGMKSSQDTRYVRIGVRYNFNDIKSGVRKRQSNAEELNRLQ